MLVHILHIKSKKKFDTIMNCFVFLELVSEELTAAEGNFSKIRNLQKVSDFTVIHKVSRLLSLTVHS